MLFYGKQRQIKKNKQKYRKRSVTHDNLWFLLRHPVHHIRCVVIDLKTKHHHQPPKQKIHRKVRQIIYPTGWYHQNRDRICSHLLHYRLHDPISRTDHLVHRRHLLDLISRIHHHSFCRIKQKTLSTK